MKGYLLPPVIIIVFFAACTGKNNKGNTASENDTLHYFQTTTFIKKDIAEVNKTPFYIYKLETVNGKKDSVQINTAEFNQLTSKFLHPDITEKALKPLYKEAIFEDQSTESFAINYTAKDKNLEIQSVNILLKEDGKTVKNIFIRKYFTYPDSSVIEQLSWKPEHSFQINKSVNVSNKSKSTYQAKVVWNDVE